MLLWYGFDQLLRIESLKQLLKGMTSSVWPPALAGNKLARRFLEAARKTCENMATKRSLDGQTPINLTRCQPRPGQCEWTPQDRAIGTLWTRHGLGRHGVVGT